MWTRGRRGTRSSLEDEGSDGEDTGETSAREGHGLASTGGDRAGLGWGGAGVAAGGLDGGGVGVAAGAGNGRDSGDRLGDGARAVGDGESGGLSDGVDGTTVGDLSGDWAVGGQSSDDLGNVGHVGPGVDASGESENSSSGLHFDGGEGWVV